MASASAGVQSTIDVNSPTVLEGAAGTSGRLSDPATWAWIWFIVAVFIILGFHVRVFGHPVPPAATFP